MGVFGALCAIACFLKSFDFGLLVSRAWAFVSRPDTFTFSSFVLQASGFYSFQIAILTSALCDPHSSG
jgi:hypothetical protein